jgi:hypothetical protein
MVPGNRARSFELSFPRIATAGLRDPVGISEVSAVVIAGLWTLLRRPPARGSDLPGARHKVVLPDDVVVEVLIDSVFKLAAERGEA